MFSVLNMYSHCLCVRVQLAHTTSNLLATFQWWFKGQCSQPRNADPPEQHRKAPPYGFPNSELFPYGYAKSTLLSHPYPSIIPLLYCTIRDYLQCTVFKDNQVSLQQHCRHFVRLSSSQFLCQPQKDSEKQVTRPVVPETSLFHQWKLHFWDGLSM